MMKLTCFLSRLLPESRSQADSRPQRACGARPSHFCCYDLDDLDVAWLELVNHEFRRMALPELDELTMEYVLVELESTCEEKMRQAIETEEGLGIEYDEDVVCDVCRSPEGEDGNEMVFCDKCNVCVHQACYGILKVPRGNWLCRTCALGVQPKCLLCPKRGGALKPTRSGTKWVHVSCALWIPEVSIGCPEKMEPITKVSHIPASRWALSCSLCREHTGTCIQCSMPSCIVAFHVTCAFDHNLEMRTILAENDEVRFKSFCLEHSCTAGNGVPSVSHGNHATPTTNGAHASTHDQAAAALCPALRPHGSGDGEQRAVLYPASVSAAERAERDQLEREKVSLRKQKLQELEDEFYRLVDPRELAENLELPVVQVDFLYQFWKLKRKANFNRPLVTLKRDEVDNLAQQEQDLHHGQMQFWGSDTPAPLQTELRCHPSAAGSTNRGKRMNVVGPGGAPEPTITVGRFPPRSDHEDSSQGWQQVRWLGVNVRPALCTLSRSPSKGLAASSAPAGRQPCDRETRRSRREQYTYETAHLGRMRAAFEPNEPPPRRSTYQDLGVVCDEKINPLKSRRK
ncbi:hypothetical protein fugu_009391 [Takifugu bimaculatus]|uniref:PHD-type domain-containing protein n=1 Tax=Takifugu bimaculatus TaxID=433685 RepID=A0A4Z2AYG9_9TELE|nr:hypothetical protein fugu_009391 [Takifugu bimaculatus]